MTLPTTTAPISTHWPDQPWFLVIEPDPSLPHWMVYAPHNPGLICIEPISHVPDALNLFGAGNNTLAGMVDLAPADQWTASAEFVSYASSSPV